MHRVLGDKCYTTDDTIFVQPTTKVTNTTSFTLRTVLRTVARIFDPLGILAPFVITFKILLQNLWKTGISWGETVPSDFVPIIDKWFDQSKQVPPVRLLRLLGPQLSPSDIQLHAFRDESQDARLRISTSELHVALAYKLLLWLAEKNTGSNIELREHSETGITSSPYRCSAVQACFWWNANKAPLPSLLDRKHCFAWIASSGKLKT